LADRRARADCALQAEPLVSVQMRPQSIGAREAIGPAPRASRPQGGGWAGVAVLADGPVSVPVRACMCAWVGRRCRIHTRARRHRARRRRRR
jgi:hypothetical protein